MQTSGTRRYFAAKVPKKLAELRARLVGKQNRVQGVSISSVSRLEHGSNVREQTAEKYCAALTAVGASVSLREDFRLGSPEGHHYNWTQLMNAAQWVGRKVFDEFGANAILTFPGPSGIFAHLVMAISRPKDQFVRLPVYTAFLADSKTQSVSGFKRIHAKRFNIFVPTALIQGDPKRRRRIAIIDDSITTGRALQALREYFQEAGYNPKAVRAACCVCYRAVTLVRGEQPEIVRFKALNPRYRMPWGLCLDFESCFLGTRN